MTQIARPTSSNTWATGWTATPSAADNLKYQRINDQSDSSQLSKNGLSSNYGEFANLSDPGVNTGHTLWARTSGASGTGNSIIELYQGDPNGSGVSVLSGSLAITETAGIKDESYALSTTEAANITDYTDLWWLLSSSGGTHNADLYELWLEIPGGDIQLTGSLYAQAATFPTGTVQGTQTLTGSLYAQAPTFPTGLVSSWSPTYWRDPFTWVDSTVYTAAQLNSQFQNNLEEIPHVIFTMTEDVEISDDTADTHLVPPLTRAIAENEVWYYIWVQILDAPGVGAGVTLAWPVLDLPSGAIASGSMYYLDHNGAHDSETWLATAPSGWVPVEVSDQNNIYIPASNPIGNRGEKICVVSDLYIVNGVTAGSVYFCYQVDNALGAWTVYAGTSLLGMRISP